MCLAEEAHHAGFGHWLPLSVGFLTAGLVLDFSLIHNRLIGGTNNVPLQGATLKRRKSVPEILIGPLFLMAVKACLYTRIYLYIFSRLVKP